MSDPVRMLHLPSLKEPALIVGFGGWPNAGEVSTWVTNYLIKNLRATKCAEIHAEGFCDLSEQRPVVKLEEGTIRSVEYPRNDFYMARTPGPSPRDLVLFLGHEPHFHWTRFTEVFLDVAQRLGVVEMYTLGGVYDNIPHTVEPRVSGLTTDRQHLERFPEIGIHPADYQGPMSIHTHLVFVAGKKGIPTISLWGHVPYYIQSSNAKTCLAVIERLQRLVGFKLDLAEVRRACELLDEQIDRIIQTKPEIREYIESLEQDYHSGETPPPRKASPGPDLSTGEKIIRIDPFLRKGPNSHGPR